MHQLTTPGGSSMYRNALTCGLLRVLSAPVLAPDPTAEALQRDLKDAIRRAKPSIARTIDSRSDLAVLNLLTPEGLKLKSLPIGRGDELEQGDFVIGLTYPQAAGFRETEPSAYWGNVSKLHKPDDKVRDNPPDEERGMRLY